MDFPLENRVFAPPASPGLIPQPALELKRTFREALQTAVASRAQQQQLCGMVPVVLVAKLGPQVMAAAARAPPRLQPEELGLGGAHPLDFLLLDTPLGGPLGLDPFLDGDPGVALKPEERKCPYCPDRFHNGIGLANHVRGHLNRVGVSYNVRHFISAEEVKAIERRFSFQKKKKKVANFDPGTFSLMRCDFCGAGFDTRAGLSSHARAHLRDFGITNWELTVSPINILQELLATSAAERPPSPLCREAGVPPSGFLTSRRPRLPLTVPFPPTWAEDPGPAYGDGLGSEENAMVAMDLGSPPLPKKSLPVPGPLEQVANRLSSKMAAEVPHGSKQELPDLKAQSLTTCEVCGACFETRKGLSSHARSHLRQLGVAESESSGAPIDLLYELVKQKGLPDTPLGLPPSLTKKSSSPKEIVAGAPRPGLLALAKPLDAPAVNKAIKSPPGFSAKGLAHPPNSPLLKKASLALAGSPTHKNPEDKSPQLSLSPRPASPKAQWPQSEDEGPLNLTLDSDGGRELDCQLCGAWFETRRGLSSHARAHLRHLGVSDPDAKGSPIDVLHGLIRRAGVQIRLPLGRGALALLGRPPPAPAALSLLPPPPPAKRAKLKAKGTASPWGKQDLPAAAAAGIFWASDVEPSPLNLSSGPEPARDIRCEFCGEFFENRKGLSSHARSHLRQMGVTEWYVNGSPIDTLREILKRRTQSRPGGPPNPSGPSPKALAKVVSSGGPGSSLEARSPADLHLSPLAKKLPPPPGSPLGHSPTVSPPPTARKMFPGLSSPSLPKKLKPEQMRVEIKREMLPGALHGEPHPSEGPWVAPREDMTPLNLSSRAEPVRDIRCEFCGEFFENRKGLSSHARSHLRQMGVTEWSVNGSPIDTLREILKKKSKPCLIKKEPPAGDLAPALTEDGPPTVAPGPMQAPLPLAPMAGRPGKPGAGPAQIPRELTLAPITGTKHSATGYLGSPSPPPLPEPWRAGPRGKMVDYSVWDHIEVSDDEDETHPNIDTASLFRWRHQARVERMEQFQKEKEELDRGCRECKRKVAECQRKLKELEVAEGEGGKAELERLQAEAQQLRKEERSWEQKLEEMRKKEKSMPWNVDTLSKDGFSKSMVNTKPEQAEEESEEVREQKHKTFVEKYEKQIKHFGMLRRWDDSQKYLSDNVHLVCEETANYLVIWCIDLEVEEKCALMEQVAHQTIVMQFILELAKSLKVDPRACFRQFFTKIKTADRQYMEGFNDELEAFKDRVRGRAKLRIEKAMKEYEEEERKKRLGPGGLDPVEVYESLPEELQKCFDAKDVQMLQDAISKMDPTDAKYHMQRCIDSGLWVPNSKSSEAKEGEEAGTGEPLLEATSKSGDEKDVSA